MLKNIFEVDLFKKSDEVWMIPFDGLLESLVHFGGLESQLVLGLVAADGPAEHGGEEVEVTVLSGPTNDGKRTDAPSNYLSANKNLLYLYFGSESFSTPSTPMCLAILCTISHSVVSSSMAML